MSIIFSVVLTGYCGMRGINISNDEPLKASELVAILQKRIEEFGDLEILINTKFGAMYGLFSEDEVICTPTTYADGRQSKALQIGTN